MSEIIDFEEKRIIRGLIQGDFRLSNHATIRAQERNIFKKDIIFCAKTVSEIKKMDGKYRVKGLDCDGESLTIICVWIGRTLVITLF